MTILRPSISPPLTREGTVAPKLSDHHRVPRVELTTETDSARHRKPHAARFGQPQRDLSYDGREKPDHRFRLTWSAWARLPGC